MGVGTARLNGFNGMGGMPSLTIPGLAAISCSFPMSSFTMSRLRCSWPAIWVFACWVNSRFGNVLVAIRENPQRAEMLGYDIRMYQLATFVIGSAFAGLSGVLYTSWGNYITLFPWA